jgi:hypothetical protein
VTAVAIAGCGGSGSSQTSTTTAQPPGPPMPLVQARGSGLVAAGRPFVAYGFNYAGPVPASRVFSFDRAGPERMRRYIAGMRRARDLGANTLRIYLQLSDFIKRTTDGRVEGRPRALANLRRVLRAAERLGLYLDVTGNLVWVPGSAPRWYNRLPYTGRWLIQARFWGLVSAVTAQSSAILCYELTSEPAIGTNARRWYTGRFGGLNFVQLIVRDPGGREPGALAHQWVTALSGAIRRNDPRHLIGIGLGSSTTGAFAPRNVAGSLDLLLVHLYPKSGQVADAERTLRRFAAPGKPVIIGETLTLRDSPSAQTRFLLGARRYASGFLTFLGSPGAERPSPQAIGVYRANLRGFLAIKRQLVAAR